MKNKLIVIDREKEGRAGTLLIAKGFGRRHDQILRLIKKYQINFENLSPLKGEKIKGKGRATFEYLLTQDQFLFLGTLFKNSPIVVEFKERLIKEFSKTRNLLFAAKSQHVDQKWVMSRDFGKEARLKETESIKSFTEYAEKQGSQNSNRYYVNITKMMNNLLFVSGDKFQNLREVLTPLQLMTVASAEQIISKGLTDGMKAKMFYKDIYKEVKARVTSFVQLHGRSEVIEKQLMIKD